MASPVDTSVKVFYSTMTGAPQGFRGVIGSALPIIKACLVDGFDEVTLDSLVVSGGVATATFPTSHSAVPHSVVLIVGATGSGLTVLNGEQKVVTRVGNTATFDTDAPDGAAGGTITMKMAPAGWSEAFTGTNLLALRPNDPDGNRHFLRLQDTATTTLRALGYENMTAIGTGTGQFPTTGQLSGGVYWPKSDVANTTDNPWMIVADGKRFYMGVATGYASSTSYVAMHLVCFGDFHSYRKVADPYSTVLTVGGTTSLSWDGNLSAGSVANVGYAPRPYSGVGTSTSLISLNSVGLNAQSGNSTHFGAYPGMAEGMYLSKLLVSADISTLGPRGEFAGLWQVPQYIAPGTFAVGDTIPGGGETAGRTLMVMPCGTSSSTAAAPVLFDVTGPW
ncbi:MAG: hypothetical protein ACK4OE_08940 [Acidovorax sp.]|uniref:hypothetical protein n=1 Tax=Acidovorax sp. TaxID=1872122 RepID=UPI00391967FB